MDEFDRTQSQGLFQIESGSDSVALEAATVRVQGAIPRLLSRLINFAPFVVGVVLLLTAAAKIQQLFQDNQTSAYLLSSRWFQIALIFVEVSCGLALLMGLVPRLMRRLCLLLFAGFLLFSTYQSFAGAKSCGCLGTVEVAPILMAFLDAGVLGCLWRWQPANGSESASGRCGFAVYCGSILLLVTALALLTTTQKPPKVQVSPALTDLGLLTQGDRREFSVLLSNTHSDKVAIVRVQTSCPCLVAQNATFDIEPGKQALLALSFDLTKEPAFRGNLHVQFAGLSMLEEPVFFANVAVRVVGSSGD